MNPELPRWLLWITALTPLFQFLGTVAIGVAAAYIARGQWRTNQAKLKLDLYDRRLAVYEASMKFVLGLTTNAMVDADATRQFLVATRQAPFLFDDTSLPDYLAKLAHEAQRLNMIADMGRRIASGEILPNPPKPEAPLKIMNWFLEQEKVIKDRFAPYLQLSG